MPTRALLLACALLGPALYATGDVHAAVITEPAQEIRVLVVDLEGAEVSADRRASIVGLIAARLAQHRGVDVIAGADLRRLVGLEAERQQLGCTDESCLTELADAMGAELVVFGDVAQLGPTMVLNLNMFDSRRARSVGRSSVRGADLGELADQLDAAVDELVRPTLDERGLVATAPSSTTTETSSAPAPGTSVTPASNGDVWLDVVVPASLVTAGVVLAGGGLAFDLSSSTSANAALDGGDFVGPGLMTVGVAGIAVGAGLVVMGALDDGATGD